MFKEQHPRFWWKRVYSRFFNRWPLAHLKMQQKLTDLWKFPKRLAFLWKTKFNNSFSKYTLQWWQSSACGVICDVPQTVRWRKWLVGFKMCQRKKMTKNSLEIVFFAIFFMQTFACGESRIITGSSPLDNLIIRPLFHSFRNMTFRLVGQTGLRNTGKYLQEPLTKFPCDTTFGRSGKPPTSVHKLRPGEILRNTLQEIYFKGETLYHSYKFYMVFSKD